MKSIYVNKVGEISIVDIEEIPTEEPIILSIPYEQLVEQKIRIKYSISEEFAILRQKEDKITEWQEYYNYCEQCKEDAKKELVQFGKELN